MAQEEHPWYDQCGATPDWTDEESVNSTSTGWTVVFKINAWCNLLMLFFTIIMLGCVAIPKAPSDMIFFANCCVCCLGVPLVTGPILGYVRKNNEIGKACTINGHDITYIHNIEDADLLEEDTYIGATTFSENAAAMRALYTLQAIFLCPM